MGSIASRPETAASTVARTNADASRVAGATQRADRTTGVGGADRDARGRHLAASVPQAGLAAVPLQSAVPKRDPSCGGTRPQLVLGTPGDSLEAEAERMASQVARGPVRAAATPSPQSDRGRAQDDSSLRLVQEVLASPGQPLDSATRAVLEPRFGCDFGQVRVHADAQAARSAAAIDAVAYAGGRHLAFTADHYAPRTGRGARLLAHELAHVAQWQAGAADESALTVRRQMSPTPDPAPGPDPAADPGHTEQAHAPSFRVRIIAHASPRWRGARSPAAADRLNLELSRRRGEAVRTEVERLMVKHFGAGVSIDFDVDIDAQDNTVAVDSEARGSRDTLREARGDRADNARDRRRVDVIIDSSQRVSGQARSSRPPLMRSNASKFWHVSVDMSAGASLGGAGALLKLTLTNDLTGRQMQGTVFAGGGGPKASLGASASIWGDPTGFSTDAPVDFRDFEGVWVRYTSAGVNLFIGWETAYISFIGMGRHAQSIDVGGWNTGTVGVGGSVVAGPLSLDGPFPPSRVPIKGSDVTTTDYERDERGGHAHRVEFATESSVLASFEADVLDSFVASSVTATR